MSNSNEKPVTKPETNEAYKARLKAQANLFRALLPVLPEPELYDEEDFVENEEAD